MEEGVAAEKGLGLLEELGLNPQLFVNEVLNSVDDILDSAFDFFLQQAPDVLSADGREKRQELARGVYSLRHLVRSVLDARLESWEKYCLRHCFDVPEAFVFTKRRCLSGEELSMEAMLSDDELDSRIESLRRKIVAEGEEYEELQRQIASLGKQSKFSSTINTTVSDVQKLLEENSVQEACLDISKTLTELRRKMLDLKRKQSENLNQHKISELCGLNEDEKIAGDGKGVAIPIEDIQELVKILGSG